jgi:hypothetical protein
MEADTKVWYASGRASLETSYMWALTARLKGTNNLPIAQTCAMRARL